MRVERARLLLASQPMHSGVAHHLLDLVGAIDPTTYELHVACPRDSVVWQRLEGRDDLALHEIAAEREPAPADVRSLLRLLPLVRRADIVHAHSSKAGFLGRLACAATRRRGQCIFTPHGWSFWAAEGGRARLYTRLERLAAHWCSVIVTLSESERDAGLRAGVGRAPQYRVIPNGVDLERFSLPRTPVPGRILWVGRFAPPKRADLAVHALASLRARVPGAELHLVGDGAGKAEVERLVAELGLDESVRFLGTRDDVPALLSDADCVVLASDYEGCPLSVIEAMAAGVPVVATRVGGVDELIEHGRTGLLAEPGRPESIAAALAAVIGAPERGRELGDAARAEARARLSRERMTEATLSVYEEVRAAGR